MSAGFSRGPPLQGEDGGGQGGGGKGSVTPASPAQLHSFALRERKQTHFSPLLDGERVRWSVGSEDRRAGSATVQLFGPFVQPQSSVSPGSVF